MSIYIKTITLTKLVSLLLIFVTIFSLILILSYSVHNSITTVSADVMIGKFNFGGLKKEYIHNYLESIAHEFYNQPQNAYIDPETKSLIPHLNGTKLNIEKTAQLIAKAKRGESVIPVIESIKPEKTIKDFGNIPIYQGNPIKEQVALIINISWGNEFNEYLKEMLDILEQDQVKGNFFFSG